MQNIDSHPPTPEESGTNKEDRFQVQEKRPPTPNLSREEIRFLSDVATRPLSGTVSRYQRLNLSRRRGNAVRLSLSAAGLIEAIRIATRGGQVVLIDLTETGRSCCAGVGIDAPSTHRPGLEHRYWAMKVAEDFQERGFEVSPEYHIKGDGMIDLLAERPGERIAIEIETGKSDIESNLKKLKGQAFDRIVVVATAPSAVTACRRALEAIEQGDECSVELWTWLDVT